MKLKRFIFLFVLFIDLFAISSAHAQAAKDLLADLLNNTHTLRANFTQTVLDNHGKAIQTSQGTMALQRPGKFRWQVTKPSPQLIIANDTKLWIYDPDLEQVVIRSLQKGAGATPAFLLTKVTASLENDFVIKQIQKGSTDEEWFMLTPKGKDEAFESIQLGFLNDQLHTMQLQDHLGHSTIIQFQTKQINVPLPASLFVFQPPAKVDVIDETKQVQ